jgi:hypothetical protein
MVAPGGAEQFGVRNSAVPGAKATSTRPNYTNDTEPTAAGGHGLIVGGALARRH